MTISSCELVTRPSTAQYPPTDLPRRVLSHVRCFSLPPRPPSLHHLHFGSLLLALHLLISPPSRAYPVDRRWKSTSSAFAIPLPRRLRRASPSGEILAFRRASNPPDHTQVTIPTTISNLSLGQTPTQLYVVKGKSTLVANGNSRELRRPTITTTVISTTGKCSPFTTMRRVSVRPGKTPNIRRLGASTTIDTDLDRSLSISMMHHLPLLHRNRTWMHHFQTSGRSRRSMPSKA